MNNFAVSNTDILEGLQRSSAAMSAMGQDLDSTIALFTAANEVLQDPASTGTALRSMALRMRGFDEETEQLSDDLIGITGKIVDYTKTAEHAQGVSIFTDATQTEYKDFVDYFRELSEVWDEMSAKNQTALLNDLFGKRGAQAGSALIKNFETVDAALEKMQNSAGNAEKEMSIITESLSYKLNALKETGTGIAQNLFQRKDIGMVVDGLTSILSVVDKLTEKLGLFGTIGAGAGIFGLFKSFGTLQDIGKMTSAFSQLNQQLGFMGKYSGAGMYVDGIKRALAGMTSEAIGATAAMMDLNAEQLASIVAAKGLEEAEAAKALAAAGFSASQAQSAMISAGYSESVTQSTIANTEFAASAGVATGATNTFGGALKNVATGLATFLTTNPIGWAIMVVGAMGIAMAAVAKATKTFDDFKEAADSSRSEYQTTQGEVDSLNQKIETNNKTIDELKAKGTLNLVEESQLSMLTATNEQLQKQVALKEKVANTQQVQAAKDASAALNEKTQMLTRNTGTKENPKYTTENVSILDETLDLQDKYLAKEEKIAELEAERDKYDYGSKEYEKLNKQVEQAERDSADLHNQITNNLEDIADLRESLYDSNTGEAVKEYDSAGKVIRDYGEDLKKIDDLTYDLMTDGEKAAYKQSKIDNLLKDSAYKSMADDMLEFAKSKGDVGITSDDIKKNFGDIATAAQDAGIDIDDLAQSINAMTGSVNMKEVTKQLNDMKNSVKDKNVQKFLDDLFNGATDEELKIYYRIMKSGDTSDWSIEDWQGAIEEMQNQEVEIEFNISAEAEKIDTLRGAISESRADTGLNQETISNIRTYFGELEGFDESKIFYNTANGVRANSDALRELQRQYVNTKKADLNEQLQEQIDGYNKAKTALDGLKEGTSEYEEASAKVDLFADQINQTEQLISQYNALTSAYNEWVAAQSMGNERDMYQNAASGYESTGSLIEQGWVNDDSVQAYIDLMTYGDKASFTADEVRERYAQLGETIEGTSHSVEDFFLKLDSEGNAVVDETSGGITNFVNTLQELGRVDESGFLDASKADEYAQALGVDVSLVETMIRAASEAGYQVNNAWEMSTTTLEEVNSQLQTAQQELEQFRNEDGTININAEGAEEAQQKVSDLVAKKQELEQSSGVMSIDLDTAGFDEGVSNAIAKLQELQSAINEYESAKIAGVDTSEAESKIQSLASEINGMDAEIKASVGIEDGSDIASQIESLASGAQVEVGAKLDGGAASAITSQLSTLNAEAVVNFIAKHEEVDSYAAAEKQGKGTVTWGNNSSAVDSYAASEKSGHGTVHWSNDTSGVQTSFSATGTVHWTNAGGPGSFTGNAFASGNALAHGKWGGNVGGNTLLGEIGREIVVDPQTGKWYTVGDNGAEFRNIPPNAIVFNHLQTESLLKNGRINSRGHAMASGNAMLSGNAMAEGSEPKLWDWVELFIERMERGIKKIEKAVDNAFKTWGNRNKSLTKEISEVEREIKEQQKAYTTYMNEANKIDFESNGWGAWKARITEGGTTSVINYNGNEDLNKAIEKYQDFYEKALDAQDAIEELKEKMGELYSTAFENIEKNFDDQLDLVDHLTETFENGVDLLEAKGRLVGVSYYNGMKRAEKENAELLEKELSSLVTAYNNAMNSGYIEMYSEQWYEFNQKINDAKESLQETNVEIAELAQKIREIGWDNFDYLEDRITTINDESEFMISLLSHKELKNEDGTLSDAGMATLGLHGQSYNVYMAQANDYAKEIKKLNKSLNSDPNNTDLIKRREELYELQRKMILAAEDEKDAMLDLVEEGYKAQKESIKDLIDEYIDALESAKNLYDYQKKVKKQTEAIAQIEKQLSAYGGDTSEENKARIQKLQVDLEEAQADLAETEYEKYIKDQKKLLNDFYSEYETNINERIDNIDYTITELIDTVNSNSGDIGSTLSVTAKDVGYTMTDEMRAIWANNTSSTNSIIAEYSGKFDNQLTSVNAVLSSIDAKIANMVKESDAEANTTRNATTKTTSVTKPKTTTTKNTTTTKKAATTTTANTVGIVTPTFDNYNDRLRIYESANANSKLLRLIMKGNIVETDWKESNGFLHVRVHNNWEDYWGWANKSLLRKYARGARRVNDGFAWTQEYGQEAILRPTSNAILTQMKSGDAVLNAKATDNLFDFGNNPQAFLAKLGITNGILSTASLLSGLSKTTGKSSVDVGGISITIPIEHVDDYNDFVDKVKSDSKFEKFIQSITVDRLVGGSSLAKHNIW